MLEQSTGAKILIPLDKIPSARTAFNWYAIFIPMLAGVTLIASRSKLFFLIVSIPMVLYLLYDFFTRRFVSKLILDSKTGVLKVEYINSLGMLKTMAIRVSDAYYEYKLNVTKGGAYWRLLIYNNYMRNQLVLREAKKMDFQRPS